jgi:hypothetical protein
MSQTKTTTEPEIYNLFETMLRKQRRGLVANEVSRKLAEAIQAARECSAKASMTVSVTIKPTNDDQVMIDVQCDTKLPKEKMPPSMFWVGEGNTLHTSDPRQPELPLREVIRDEDELRDVCNG